jgi:tRNA dimethylallyltransferase
MTVQNKLVAIVGPTASGKSDLAVKLAKKFDGEIISADSRQVYRGLDIGSGKITRREMHGIPHHLLDVASPRMNFSAGLFQKKARLAVAKIQKKGKLPILAGGTGFFVDAVLLGTVLPAVKPDWALRKKLALKSCEELFKMIQKRDPATAARIDRRNPRRLIRALEIILTTKKPIRKISYNPLPQTLIIGLNVPENRLKKLIASRLNARLKKGMVAETARLKVSGLSWKRLESFGLEYRYTALYLQKKITRREMIDSIQKESVKYAKRQMAWFKKYRAVRWIKKSGEADKLVSAHINGRYSRQKKA